MHGEVSEVRCFVDAHLDDRNDERAECRRARVKPKTLLQGPPERAVVYLSQRKGGAKSTKKDEDEPCVPRLGHVLCVPTQGRRAVADSFRSVSMRMIVLDSVMLRTTETSASSKKEEPPSPSETSLRGTRLRSRSLSLFDAYIIYIVLFFL